MSPPRRRPSSLRRRKVSPFSWPGRSRSNILAPAAANRIAWARPSEPSAPVSNTVLPSILSARSRYRTSETSSIEVSATGLSNTISPRAIATTRSQDSQDMVQVMADEDAGDPLGRQAAHEAEHFGGLLDRQVIGRFVEDEYSRLEMHRARDRHALALSARQFGEQRVRRARWRSTSETGSLHRKLAYELLREMIYALAEGREGDRHSASGYAILDSSALIRTIFILSSEHSLADYARYANASRDKGELARCLEVAATRAGLQTVMDRFPEHLDPQQRVMASASRSEAVAPVAEPQFENRFNHEPDSLLDDAILDRRDSQRPRSSIALGAPTNSTRPETALAGVGSALGSFHCRRRPFQRHHARRFPTTSQHREARTTPCSPTILHVRRFSFMATFPADRLAAVEFAVGRRPGEQEARTQPLQTNRQLLAVNSSSVWSSPPNDSAARRSLKEPYRSSCKRQQTTAILAECALACAVSRRQRFQSVSYRLGTLTSYSLLLA